MRTKIGFIVFFFFLIYSSCEKKENIPEIDLNDLFGKWESESYNNGIRRGMDNNDRFHIDSTGNWWCQLELHEDLTCYYMEFKMSVDTFSVMDTGTFYVKRDWLYLEDIQPVYFGFSDPFGGQIQFKRFGMLFEYEILDSEIGELANVTRLFNRVEE